MSEIVAIRDIARQVLTFPTSSGSQENWLWDRTLRIQRNLEQICRLPEPAEQAIAIDRSCLITATYFSESGLKNITTQRKNTSTLIPPDINYVDLCNLSTQIVSEKLKGVISEQQTEKVNTIITESCNRLTDVTEAMILSDSRNLEDMGTVGLLGELRRHIIQGKGISDILESWKCKIEYGYWQARLKESFRFDAVRQIAKQRFSAVVHFMNHLSTENTGSDLEERLLEILEKTK